MHRYEDNQFYYFSFNTYEDVQIPVKLEVGKLKNDAIKT